MCGMALKSENVIFSWLEKSWTKKYHSNRFNHLSMASASMRPSNMGISKLSYTLKGVVPAEWLLDEDALPVDSHWIIWAKLSIIASLYHSRASLSNILKGSPALLHVDFFHVPWMAEKLYGTIAFLSTPSRTGGCSREFSFRNLVRIKPLPCY